MQNFLNFFIKRFGFIALLLAFWLGFSPAITMQTVATGLFLSIVIKKVSDYLFQDIYRISVDYRFILGFFRYFLNLFANIFLSAFALVPIIFNRKDDPIIFTVHLKTKNPLLITLVANAITLTPGTITLDVSEEQVLSVLSIVTAKNGTDAMAQAILDAYEKPFEKMYRRDNV